jgi:hypothetical protein
MKYLALIGDVVDSRRLPRRDEFQLKLEKTLKHTSSRNPSLASPYTITLGDEFQAVYRNADRLFADIFAIWRDLNPAAVRIAIGVGGMSTAINSKQALGMDGPAFHHARDAITVLKTTGHRLQLRGDPPTPATAFDQWKLLNHLFDLVSHQIGAWEKNRLHIMQGLLAGRSATEIEGELAISKVAVYKNINSGALEELRGVCTEVTKFLNQVLKQP